MSKLNWAKRACAVLILCTATAIVLPAQTFSLLHSFDNTDGNYPVAGLVQALDGNLYGTTYYGGTSGDGTIFRITPSGTLTTIYNFCSQYACADGATPQAPLIQSTNGDLYGTTTGTVFKITPGGALTTLYKFCAQGFPCVDGNDASGLVQGADGNMYGITLTGGAYGWGTIFKVTPGGTLTTLYSFCSESGCPDGEIPVGGLVQGTNGYFYGVTLGGGAYGGGTVFKITSSGNLTTLYSFCLQTNCPDGESPWAPLIQAVDGNFYGTTGDGGANPGTVYGAGTVFRISPSGTLTTLYSFCSQANCTDGNYPVAGLIQATDGNFYGTTYSGGVSGGSCSNTGGCGVVFKITPSGKMTTLHAFHYADGKGPEAGLVQATAGNFYGTTYYGGSSGACYGSSCGTVYRLSVGLGPFVETKPTFGKTGAVIKILGTNLTGAISVTFNGVPATFTVVSSSEITTTVPSGATTGKVQVVTPSGTLSSNVPFRVAP